MVVPDNLYTYDLRLERPIIMALVRQAAVRYLERFGSRPVNAVEVGFWVEGARLVVRLISNPAYDFNWIIYPEGYSEHEGRASYGEFSSIPSWALLGQLSGFRDMLVRDGNREVRLCAVADGYQEGWRDTVEAIGHSVMRAVLDAHRELLTAATLTDPCEVTVYEDEDSSLAWYLSVSGGNIEFQPAEGRGSAEPGAAPDPAA